MKSRIFFSLIVISLLYSNNIIIEPVDFYQDGQIKKEKHFNLDNDKKKLVEVYTYYENGNYKAKHPIKIKEEMDLMLSTIKMIKNQSKVNLRMASELENGLSIVKKDG